MPRSPSVTLVAVCFAAAFFTAPTTARADTFGSGTNAFNIDFVTVGNANNSADTNGFGSLSYGVRMGKFEISRVQVNLARAGGLNTSSGFPGSSGTSQPAMNMSWFQAASFVNWLNTNSGYQAAYNLNDLSMSLWSADQAWTLGGTNLYRNKNAYYFLPSENEWYKAAYYNAAGTNYFRFPTASNTAPTAVGSGTNSGTAVYNSVTNTPAVVSNAGGLSAYGTMGQGGNVWEWAESAFDKTNSSVSEQRTMRGGGYNAVAANLDSGADPLGQEAGRSSVAPNYFAADLGFRVASRLEYNFWAPAAGGGGSGVWSTAGTNWAFTAGVQGSSNQPSGFFLAFAGTAGTVSVADGGVSVDAGMRFSTAGYLVQSNTITLSGTNASDNTITTDPSVSATISSGLAGSSGLTKAGTGTLTLSGFNTFTGPTEVAAGRLIVNGTNNTDSAVNVSSGASLGGAGRVGALTVSGTVAPGNSIGTLSAGSTVFNTNGSFQLEIADWAGAAGTGWDLLAISGDLTLSNTSVSPFTISLVSMTNSTTPGLSSFNRNQSYTNTFVTYSGGLLGSAFNTNLFSFNTNSFQNAINGSFSVATNAGGLAVVYTTLFNPDAPYMWTNPAGGNWSLASGWSNATTTALAPSNGSTVIFRGTWTTATNMILTNDSLVTSLNSITFTNTGGPIALTGSAFSISSNGIANGSGYSHTISNNVSLTDSATTFNTVSNNLTMAGSVSGAGGLTKAGAGTLVFSGTNSYGGGTLISAGVVSGGTAGIQGDVTNNGSVIFNQATNGTYAGAMTGTGILVKTNAGTLTLTGENTQSGATVGQGTLQIGDGGSTGSLGGPITNNTSLIYNRTGKLTQSGAVTGTGTLIKQGGGTVTLTGSNSQSATLVSAGMLQIGDGGATGSMSGRITNNALLAFNRSGSLTHTSEITGTGSLIKDGAGTLILTETSLQGGATVSAGTLQIGNGGATGFLIGSITNNASLVFNRSNHLEYTNSITGTGSLTKLGAGTLILTAANSQGGATVSAGTLQIGKSDTSASLGGPITNNATLLYNRSGDLTQIGAITGTGNLIKTNTGTLTLTGDNAQNSTLIGDGVLRIGEGGSTGSLSGPITNNASLVFNRSSDLTHSNVINGTGSLTKLAGGTLTLTASNTQSGTLVSAGTLQIGDGGATGFLSGTITNNATLIFNRSNNLTHSNAIVGAGSLTKLGAGTLTLTADITGLSPTNNKQSGILVSAGALQVGSGGTNGILNGPITNNATLIFNRSSYEDSFFGTLARTDSIIGTGNLVKLGAGTLVLASSNTQSGILISAGALRVGGTNNVGLLPQASTAFLNGAITNNATLILFQSNHVTQTDLISGTGNMIKDGSGTLTVTASVSQSSFAFNRGTTLMGDGGTNGFISGPITNAATFIYNRSDNFTNSHSFTTAILATTIKQGAGTLTLTASNSGSGEFSIRQGTVQVGNGGTNGTLIVGTIGVSNNATLVFNRSDNFTNNTRIQGPGSMVKAGAGTLFLTGNGGGGTVTVESGRLVLSGSLTNTIWGPANVVVNSGASLGGSYSSSGAVGNLTVNGLVAPGSPSTVTGYGIGSLRAVNTVFNTNAAFEMNVRTWSETSIEPSSGGWDFLEVRGNLTLSNTADNPFTVNLISMTNDTNTGLSSFNRNLNYTNAFVAVSGNITGNAFNTNMFVLNTNGFQNAVNGTFSITNFSVGSTNYLAILYGTFFNPSSAYIWTNGPGNWSLTNGWSNATATGVVPTNGAAVIFSGPAGTATNNLVSSLGSITFSNTSGSINLGGSGFTIGTNGVANLSGNDHSINTSLSLQSGLVAFNTGSNNLTVQGFMSGGGVLNKTGAGTLSLLGSASHNATLISQGTLRVGNGGAVGSLSGSVTNNGALVFDRSGDVFNFGAVSGTGSLRKLGAGTLYMYANNTFSGATAVDAGALVVYGTNGNSVVTVASGASLAGSGSVGGIVLNAGSTISPGLSPGTMNVLSNAVWNGGANYNWQIYNASGTAGSTNGWDWLNVSGSLDLTALSVGNKFNINLWSLSGIGPDTNGSALFFTNTSTYTWTILTASNGITGFSADKFNINIAAFNGTGGFANAIGGGAFYMLQNGNALDLVFDPNGAPQVIPEPGTWAAAALLAGAAGYVRWRRRAKVS